ncbi:MAG: aminotransferase class I/II-fold pyridoxal phosphate-dependent enzyme [Phototrophicaceae bacterium]
MPTVAKRISNLPVYVFATISRQVTDLLNQGKPVLRLDMGSPDMPPPAAVIEKLKSVASEDGSHGYSGYRGTPIFRRAVAQYYKNRFGVDLDPETEILPLIGSKEGIVNLCLAYLDDESSIAIPSISYPAYEMAAILSETAIVSLPLDSNYLPDLSTYQHQKNTKIIWINYPNNPTGAVISLDQLQQLVDFCNEHDVLLASDNPYAEITFDGYNAPSALQAHDAKRSTIEFMSLSKTYNMAGWRIGAAVGNATAIKNLLHVKSNMDSGHFKAVYAAGACALTDTPQSWIQDRNSIYQSRRDRIVDALGNLGFQVHKPSGAMYVWAKLPHPYSDDVEYVQRLLNEAYVSVAPGSAYGSVGQGFIRLSLGIPEAQLEEALERMASWHHQ